MRHRSIAGPLILIVIGAIFLINNMRPDLIAWSHLIRYWPFLLIVFGLVRLFEILIDAGRGKPLPARSFSGGSIFAVLLACLILWSISRHGGHWRLARLQNSGIDMFGEQYDYKVNARGAAAGASILVLENLRGNVSVNGGDGDEIQVEGHKAIRAYNKTSADEADRKSSLELRREGDRFVLHTNEDRVSGDQRISVDLDIKVPRRISLEARSRSGDLTVTALDGAVDLSGDRGDVRLTGIGGNAKVELNRSGLVRAVDLKGALDLQGRGGDVQLENIAGQVTINGFYSGTLDFKNLTKPLHFEMPNGTDVRMEQIPGTLTMDLGDIRANNVVGPIRVQAKSRDIEIENFSESLEMDLERGDIQLKPGRLPLAKMDVHARNGNIALALPENAEFDLKATTARGEAQNDYGDAVRLDTEGRSASLKSVAGRGPTITASTDRGTVAVSKGVFTQIAHSDPRDHFENARERIRRHAEEARRRMEEARRRAEDARR